MCAGVLTSPGTILNPLLLVVGLVYSVSLEGDKVLGIHKRTHRSAVPESPSLARGLGESQLESQSWQKEFPSQSFEEIPTKEGT